MRRKAFSNNPPEWEQAYLQKQDTPDWKEAVLAAELQDNSQNEFDVLFNETKELTAANRDNLTDRSSFLKKDDIKIASEIRSRIDRFLKDYNYKVIESKRDGANISCLTQLTRKGKDPKTIVATFSFSIEKPRFLSGDVTAEKIEAAQSFACNDETYPLTKRGFDIAFDKHGVKFADSTVIMTMYQLEEQFDADDIISGVDNQQIVPLSEQVYICQASYINKLTPVKKVVAVDNTYITERHAEQDSDSSLRLQNIEKEEVVIEAQTESQYRYYSEQSLAQEIKTEFGLIGEEAAKLVNAAANNNLMISVPGGFVAEDKFAILVTKAGLIESGNKLAELREKVSPSHITDKIQGEYRLEADTTVKDNTLLLSAKAKISGKNKIVAHEINKEAKVTLLKVATTRNVNSNDVPVDYFFAFDSNGHMKEGHARIAGKNFELDELEFFYSALEKEAQKQVVLENRPVDFQPQASSMDRNDSFDTDDSRNPEAVNDTERFSSVKDQLKVTIASAVDNNLLTQEDVDIFHNRIDQAKQISQLTQIEREFKVLTELGDL